MRFVSFTLTLARAAALALSAAGCTTEDASSVAQDRIDADDWLDDDEGTGAREPLAQRQTQL